VRRQHQLQQLFILRFASPLRGTGCSLRARHGGDTAGDTSIFVYDTVVPSARTVRHRRALGKRRRKTTRPRASSGRFGSGVVRQGPPLARRAFSAKLSGFQHVARTACGALGDAHSTANEKLATLRPFGRRQRLRRSRSLGCSIQGRNSDAMGLESNTFLSIQASARRRKTTRSAYGESVVSREECRLSLSSRRPE